FMTTSVKPLSALLRTDARQSELTTSHASRLIFVITRRGPDALHRAPFFFYQLMINHPSVVIS
ncbi:hypothetical protein OAU96_01115, partial [Planctomycetota bacterium]|nr:hypothetical protein [Planctomycetota bacterium]